MWIRYADLLLNTAQIARFAVLPTSAAEKPYGLYAFAPGDTPDTALLLDSFATRPAASVQLAELETTLCAETIDRSAFSRPLPKMPLPLTGGALQESETARRQTIMEVRELTGRRGRA